MFAVFSLASVFHEIAVEVTKYQPAKNNNINSIK